MSRKDVEAENFAVECAKQLHQYSHDWLGLLGGQPDPAWQPSQDLFQHLQRGFLKLNINGDMPDDLGRACRQVTRGTYLIRAALEWEKPRVGNGGITSRIRGDQWRVTLAWAGLEALAKATVGGLTGKHLVHLTSVIAVELPAKLTPPSARLMRLQEARAWPQTGKIPAMLDYLGVGRGFGTEMLKQWLVEGKPLKRPHELLGCAQALRHATAHGALSSSCLKSWGIRPALLPLTATVAGASVGLLAILLDQGEPCGDKTSTTD